MVLVMGGFYLLFAMMVLVVDEGTLETGKLRINKKTVLLCPVPVVLLYRQYGRLPVCKT